MTDIIVTMSSILGTLLVVILGLIQLQTRRPERRPSVKDDNNGNSRRKSKTTANAISYIKPSIWPDPFKEPSKLFYEQFVALYTPIWMSVFAVIIVTRAYVHFDAWMYLFVCGGLVQPLVLQPFFYPGLVDGNRPWYKRYAFKANLWIAVYSFIGNYFYTHYFFSVLKAKYTMSATEHQLNNVPIIMYLATHFYFSSYHWFSNSLLRFIETSFEPSLARKVLTITTILSFAYFTAFMETLTISSYPYYEFASREVAYKVGSAFYGIYFVVSFPAFYNFDCDIDSVENEANKGNGKVALTWWETVVQACGYGMIILILLDFVRISLGIPLVMEVTK